MEFDPYWKWLGISPEQQPADHYQLLGISRFEDDDDVIENAAVRQMAHVRTFQGGEHANLSQQLLNELSTARICLLNVEQKQVYDEELEARLPGEPSAMEDVPLATPVPASSPLPVAQQVSPTRPPAPAPSGASTSSSRQRTRSRRRRQQRSARTSQLAWILVLVAIVTLLVAIVLGISLFKGKSKESDKEARQTVPSAALVQVTCRSIEY